ncbi:penicillin-binding transpeptidase domain-containing protein [Tessaracoccus sp. G1721]
MRRRLLAAAMTLALLLAGCAPGPDNPEPNPSGSSSPRRDLPSADEAITAAVEALNAQDVSALPMVGPAEDAQADFETIFAGMDEIYPEVSSGSVAYQADDDVAIVELTMTYPLGREGWTYQTEARLRYSGDRWRLDWAPSIIHPELTETTRLRHTQREGRRSPINDNEGVAIVEEGAMFEVGLDKSSVEAAEWETASADLAAILKVDAAAFTRKVLANGPRAFVVAATMVQAEIPPTISQVPGAYVREISAIVGPGGSFAAPILGSVGTPTKEMIDESGGTLTINDRVGLSGLQARYDEQLRGVPLVRVDLVPRTDASASPSSSPAPEKALFQQDESVGAGIDLSLDRDLQTKAEEVLSTQTGMAALVVLDIATGGVLAAAQSPAGGTYPHVTYGNYAPGSTFKAVSALAMLRTGLTPSSLVNCPSSLKVGTYTFGNYSGYPSSALGRIPLTTAFAQSCNTAFAGAAGTVTGDQLHAAAGSLGVGTDYDVGFTSNFGTVQPGNSIDLAASMIGQGQVTMSPLGMATVAASIGAGRTVLPWLVKGEEATPTAAPLTPAEAQSLQSLMKATVDSGTGRSLQGLMTGAKTGTAQWGPTGALQTSAWMIAYNADYAVASFVEVGDSGGTTAAPLIISLFR